MKWDAPPKYLLDRFKTSALYWWARRHGLIGPEDEWVVDWIDTLPAPQDNPLLRRVK